MFAQLFEYLFGWLITPGGFTEEDLARFDIAYEEPLTMFDHERMLLENGEVVGNTAMLNDQHLIETIPCSLPSGCLPPMSRSRVSGSNPLLIRM